MRDMQLDIRGFHGIRGFRRIHGLPGQAVADSNIAGIECTPAILMPSAGIMPFRRLDFHRFPFTGFDIPEA